MGPGTMAGGLQRRGYSVVGHNLEPRQASIPRGCIHAAPVITIPCYFQVQVPRKINGRHQSVDTGVTKTGYYYHAGSPSLFAIPPVGGGLFRCTELRVKPPQVTALGGLLEPELDRVVVHGLDFSLHQAPGCPPLPCPNRRVRVHISHNSHRRGPQQVEKSWCVDRPPCWGQGAPGSPPVDDFDELRCRHQTSSGL